MRIIYVNQPLDGPDHRLGDLLNELMRESEEPFLRLRIAVAFAKSSGVLRIVESMEDFVQRGGAVEAIVGISHGGTSKQALEVLASHCTRIRVFHNPGHTFHPKLYLFDSTSRAVALVGSGNLTGGGLYTNYEHNLRIDLDLTDAHDASLYERIVAAWESMNESPGQIVRDLDLELVGRLAAAGLLFDETRMRAAGEQVETEAESEGADVGDRTLQPAPFFTPVPVHPAPPVTFGGVGGIPERPLRAAIERPEAPGVRPQPVFAISVLEGDLPQLGSSNEIRITKGIRDANPVFWDWPHSFTYDPATGQNHRDIRVRYGGQILAGYLKDFPARKPDGTKASADFRIGAIARIVQDLNEEDDLLVLKRSGDADADYDATVVNKRNAEEYEAFADGMIQYTRARSTTTGTYKKFKYVEL